MTWLGVLVATTLARLAFGYQLQTVASLGPDLLQAFDLGLAGLGTLMALYLLPGAIVALPYGLGANRFGDFPMIAAGLTLMMLGCLVCAAAHAGAHGALVLGAGRMIAGTGAVAVTVLQSKIIADRFQGPGLISAMGLSLGAFPVGMGLAQLTQGRLAQLFGWQAAFLAGGLISLASLVLFFATWREAGAPRGGRFTWPSRHECLLVMIAALIWTTYNAGYFNFLAYMPIYLAAHGHPAGEADLVLTLATWSTLPAMLLGGVVAARFGQTRVFLVGAVLNSISVAGVYFADWPILWGLLFGTLASLHAAIIIGLATLSTRPAVRAIGMAMFYTIYYAGGFFIPPLCGRVAELTGDPAGAFLCAGTISALSIPLFFWHRAAQPQWSLKALP